MLIRRFTPGDATAIIELNRISLAGSGATPADPGWAKDLADIPSYYLSGASDFLVGINADQIIAMGGIVLIDAETAEVRRLRVAPERQGRGHGRDLVQALETRAVQLGATTIRAETTTLQHGARRLYVGAGYLLVGHGRAHDFDTLTFGKSLV